MIASSQTAGGSAPKVLVLPAGLLTRQPAPAMVCPVNKAYAESFFTGSRAGNYQDKFGRSWRRRLSHRRELACFKRALVAAGPATQGLVVDVPCGAGRFAPLLAESAKAYLGLDLSLPMTRLCHEQGRPAARASAFALPLASRSASLVACIRLSHHLHLRAELEALVHELCRVADQAVVFSFMDRNAAKQILHRCKRKLTGRPCRRPMWSRSGLQAAAAMAGFRVLGFYPLSHLFSGLTLALLVREEGV